MKQLRRWIIATVLALAFAARAAFPMEATPPTTQKGNHARLEAAVRRMREAHRRLVTKGVKPKPVVVNRFPLTLWEFDHDPRFAHDPW